MAERWQSVRLDEIEPIPVVDGTLLWRPVRRTLDVGAFGINSYVAPNAGDDVVEEHTEQTLGHEELYVVALGTRDLRRSTMRRSTHRRGRSSSFATPSVKRHARAEEPSTSVLAIGGPRDAAYEPSPWEYWFAAERHRASGDFDAMVDEIASGLELHPDNPSVLYYLARAEALAGRLDDALAHVTRALEQKPEWWEHASKDTDLEEVRKLAGWPA